MRRMAMVGLLVWGIAMGVGAEERCSACVNIDIGSYRSCVSADGVFEMRPCVMENAPASRVEVQEETTGITKSLELTCQRDLHALLSELRPYWPGDPGPIRTTMEYCDDLCQARRLVAQIQAERALRKRLEETLARCQP